MVIGIIGRIGAGKTTIAKYLEVYYGFKTYSFSTVLKKTVSDLFMIPLDSLYDVDKKSEVIPLWGKSPREILQLFGTECMRNYFGQDFWVKQIRESLNQSGALQKGGGGPRNIVFDDVRFPEEVEMVRGLEGFIIKVVRPNNPYEVDQQHQSEQIDNIKYATIIKNNSDIEWLHLEIRETMLSLIRAENLWR